MFFVGAFSSKVTVPIQGFIALISTICLFISASGQEKYFYNCFRQSLTETYTRIFSFIEFFVLLLIAVVRNLVCTTHLLVINYFGCLQQRFKLSESLKIQNVRFSGVACDLSHYVGYLAFKQCKASQCNKRKLEREQIKKQPFSYYIQSYLPCSIVTHRTIEYLKSDVSL